MNKGRLIVLEGIDGSGKTTQLDLAVGYLRGKDIKCRSLSFPNYHTITGQLVECYLRGEIPADGRNGAYAVSAMYAIDRYVSFATDWKDYYEAGGILLSSRYTTSNIIYQMSKIPDDERDHFLHWLLDFEYGKLGLPKPDMVIYLDMPVEVSQKLITERYLGDPKKKDIHEKNIAFQKQCRENAVYAAEHFGWEVVDCAYKGLPRPIEDIYVEVCECIDELLTNG